MKPDLFVNADFLNAQKLATFWINAVFSKKQFGLKNNLPGI